MATASRQPCSDQGCIGCRRRLVLTARLLVTVAEIGGHTRIDTLRVIPSPLTRTSFAALDHLTVDR